MVKTYQPDWPIHTDAMLSNVTYFNDRNTESFVVIWKDLTSQDKQNQIEIIDKPKIPIYFTRPEFRNHGKRYMEPLSHLYRIDTLPSQIPSVIAHEIGPTGIKILQASKANRDKSQLRQLYQWPYSFGADYPPELFYRIWWMENCHTTLSPYVKPTFSDIEVDIIDRTNSSIQDMVDTGTDPINIISIYFKHENDMHIFLQIPDGKMGPPDLAKKQLEAYQQITTHWEEFSRKLHDMFDKTYGKIRYEFHWYKREDELKMLIDYFTLINIRRPDFVGFWNMSFDMPYMIKRIETLGANPMDIICDPHFPTKQLRFHKDERHFEIKESGDFLYSSTVPLYICLMRNYAKHRKQTLYQSYSLDAISEIELGEHKLHYADDGMNIKNLAYLDYEKFILYNIKDTLLTKQIDDVTGDCEYLWIISNANLTQYQECFSPSLSLRCVVYNEFLRQGIGEY